MRLSSEIALYVPTDVTQTPQYKFGRFYSSVTLEPELPLRLNLAIIINTEILTSKPLLVLYELFNRWGLYVTDGNDLYNIGHSETYYRSSHRPLAVHELTVPRLNPLGLNIIPSPKPNFNQNQKNLIMNSRSPVAGIIVGGSHGAVEMDRSESGRPRPYGRPVMNSSLNVDFDGPSPRVSPPQSPRVGLPSISGGSPRRRSPSPQPINRIPESTDQLAQLSYETLVKQLYGLPVELPQFLIVNDLRLEFIPFSQLSSIQIERYIIEPLLQPWAGPPSTQNRIITIFGTNGMTYLVKALYDQATNRIFPPV